MAKYRGHQRLWMTQGRGGGSHPSAWKRSQALGIAWERTEAHRSRRNHNWLSSLNAVVGVAEMASVENIQRLVEVNEV